METLPILRDLVVLVAVAIPAVALAQRFRVPGIIGFLLTGVVIGPHALQLVRDPATVGTLAEIGVVLLVFAIGLELSLARMLRMGRAIVQGSTLQMIGTIGAVAVVAIVAGGSLAQGLVGGGLVALTSSAVMLKVYADLGALDGPSARIAIPVSLFQDLWIVPLILMVDLLGGEGDTLERSLLDMALSVSVIAMMVFGGRLLVPRLLAQMARLRSKELFTLSIMFLGVGAAYVTQSVGLSLATGAFLAGLVISESEYGAQALSDVVPFRDAFGGVFFVAIGMLLDLGFVLDHPVLVPALGAAVIALKCVTGTLAVRSLRRSLATSVAAGLALTPIGEFSFILASIALAAGIFDSGAYQLFLATAVVTIASAPLLTSLAPTLGHAVARWLRADAHVANDDASPAFERADHVIVVGYGLNGRNLARVLDAAGISYVVVEQNGETVEQARAELQPIVFGDATSTEVLRQVGVTAARALVFAISSPADELRGVTIARAMNPSLHIVVRTRYVRAMADLFAAGANEVVPEEFETSLAIFSRVLRHYAVPSNAIEREVQAARAELYGMLPDTDAAAALHLDALASLGVHHAIEMIQVEPGSRAIGEHPTSLHLRRETGATVIAVVRGGEAHYTPDPAFRFETGDTVVLVGDDDALARARALFVTAPAAP